MQRLGRRPRRFVAAAAVLSLAGLGVLVSPAEAVPAATTGSAVTTTDQFVDVGAEADGTAVRLDTRLYLPGGTGPHPAVLLAHGFGGSKDSVDAQAKEFAADGNVVLTFSARGF